MKKRILAILMMLCLLTGLLPTAALATGPDPAPVAADKTTYTDWEDLFGVGENAYLTTKDIGRIWTDKSVSTEDITLPGTPVDGLDANTVKKDADADFLVVLSGLGSAATIVDTSTVPIDTVLILDMSPKMGDPDTKAQAMLTATESAIRTLMAANPNNRVAVIGYSDHASVLLPLDHYQNGTQTAYFDYAPNSGTGGRVTACGINSNANSVESTFDIDRRNSGTDKYTQSGIYLGAQELLNADTTVRVGGTQVDRAPQIILLSEGEPKDGDTRVTAPPTDTSNNIEKYVFGDGAGSDESRHAQSFAMMMTAAYVKDLVADHYTHKGAFITIGVDPATADAPDLARLCLNPKEQLSSNPHANDFNAYFSTYKQNNSVEIMRYGEGLSRADYVTFSGFPASVTSLAYNDAYYEVTDVDNADAWKKIFDEIANDIATQAPTSPTETPEGAEGTGGKNGFITFTDELGTYMKVVGTPTVLYAGQAFKATTNDNGATYTFTGTVEGNEIYGEADLADLQLTVTTDGDTQILTWKVPASLIPLRTVTAKSTTDALGETTHTIQQTREAYPIRLFYSVDRDDAVTFDQNDNDYLIAHSKDGTTSFYSNAWDAAGTGDTQYGTATAVFTPADSNAFYHYTEDTPLYVLVDNVSGGNQHLLTDAQAKDHLNQLSVISPEEITTSGGVSIDGTVYNIVRATSAHTGRGAAFFYEHRYYQAKNTGDEGELEADLLTDYHLVLNPQALIGHTDGDAGGLYIKAGSAKLSRVSDGTAAKTDNVTSTAAHYRHPVYTVDDTTVTVYLGNNGLRTEATPTGTLTVKVTEDITNADPDQEFTYTLGLYNASSSDVGTVDPLEGDYSITIDSNSGNSIWNGGTFKLKAGQTATISGLPVGTAYQITEASPAGYTPSYTNGDSEFADQSHGLIRYVQGQTVPQASLTITYAYDPAASSYTLSYHANAERWGQAANIPGNATVTGGEITLSSMIPTITLNEAGKKAVFIGWTETAVDKIYGVEDTLDPSMVYSAGSQYTISQNTTLHAVWGYDTDNDGTADVNETKRTVTYNANGGMFGSDPSTGTTKTERVPAQPNYKLNTTAAFKPTHADDNSIKVAFVGWSLTVSDTIYGLDDNYDSNILVTTVDVSSGDKAVYAVWGYDTDGDGKPDVRDEAYIITASVDGGNGSIMPSSLHVIAGMDAAFTITPEENYALDTVTIVKKSIDDSTVETSTYHNDGEQSIPGYASDTLILEDVQSNYAITVTFADDEDSNGIPDKYERTLAYDANGGYFGSEDTTEKMERGLNDSDSHRLKTTDDFKPTHAQDGGHDVLFIGWTQTDNSEAVYMRGDTLPQTCTRLTISGNMTVYAVWGLDEDNDGMADVTEDDHHITATAGSNGSINPEEAYVSDGGSATFTINADSSCAVDTITIDAGEAGEQVLTNNGGSLPTGVAEKWTSYTFSNVTEDHTIFVTFGEDKDGNGVPDTNEPEAAYTLTYHANGGAFDDGSDTLEVKDLSGTYQLTDKAPTHDSVDLDGTSVPVLFIGWMTEDDSAKIYSGNDTAPNTVTSVAMDEDKEVWAAWSYDEDGNGEPDVTETQYTVTARVEGEGGSIDPTSKTVNAGENVEFTIDAEDGYALDYITVNSDVVYANNDLENTFTDIWTLEDIQEDSAVVAYFGTDEDQDGMPDEPSYWTIKATSGSGGSIDPKGNVFVSDGGGQRFEFDPDRDYEINHIQVDGDSVRVRDSYTFEEVRENHTIHVTFTETAAGTDDNEDDDYTLYYHSNFGADKRFYQTQSSSTMKVRDYGDMKLLPVRAGYEFLCWNTEEDGSGRDYAPGDTYRVSGSSAHLYAQWGKTGLTPDDTGVSRWLNTHDHIAYLSGYADGNFGPDDNMTRAQVAQMFYRLLLEKDVPITVQFSDVPADAWYAAAVNTLASLGIVNGIGNNQFAPERQITRAEFTVIAMRFGKLDTSGANIFTDVKADDWFYDQVVGAIKYGWIGGYTDGSFRPNNTITRAEVTTIVNRMLGRTADTDFVDTHADELHKFSDVPASCWAYDQIMEATNAHAYRGSSDGEKWTSLLK